MRGVIVLSEDFVISLFRCRFCNGAVAVALLMAIVLSAAKTGQAQIVDWTNTTGTPNPWYDVGSNWVGGVAPDPNEIARFNQAATYEVWWDNTTALTTPEVKFLDVPAGEVTFLNNGGGVQHEFTILGSGGDGSLSDFSISGSSTTLTNRGLHLHSLGAAQITDGGTFILDGSHAQGAKLSVDGLDGIQVDGNLNVEAGGLVSNTYGLIGHITGSTGIATVTGSGSQWNTLVSLFVGHNSNGKLNVEAGGVVSNARGFIGTGIGSTSEATVTGSGSQWNTSILFYVGHRGNGTLNVEAGGVVSNTYANIGRKAGSTGAATVTGIGSQWNDSGFFIVGYSGDGTLNVEVGGVVSNTNNGYIGFNPGSTGVATVTGSGSQWNNSDSFYLGGTSFETGGTGVLTIQDNGLVSVTNTLKIWGPGTLDLDGGTIRAGTLDHTGGGTFNFLDGTLSVDTFDGDLTQNGGTFLIGNSPGISNVTGSYNQLGGALEIELFSGAGGLPVAGMDFDQLTADSVTLSGTLDLSADPGYLPTLGDTFSIINTTSGVSGMFSAVNNAYLSGGFTVDVIYGANDVTLEVIATLLGDFNLDGSVDGNDLTDPVDGWEARYSVDLDGGDFLDWQRNFGAVAPLAAESTSVPEPSRFALIVVGLLGIGYRCRKQP